MENLIVNINDLTKGELEILNKKIQEKIIKDLQYEIEEEKNQRKKLEERTFIIEQEHKKQKETILTIKKEIDVLGSPLHSKRKKSFKKLCSKRVFNLLNNNVSSCEYIIFSPFLYKKIYIDIANYFELDTYLDLNMENYDREGSKYSEAKEMVIYWKPSSSYIKECIKNLIDKRDNGFLRPERCRALSEYLKITNNGEINPFSL